MLLEILTIISIIINTTIFGYVILKIKNIFHKIKMNAEELLQNTELNEDDKQDTKRERLSAIVAGGGSKQYLGRDL